MLALNIITGSVLLSANLINALPFVYDGGKINRIATKEETNLVQAIGEAPHSFTPIIVVDGSEIETLASTQDSRVAVLPVPVAMTSVPVALHSDEEIERIQQQVEDDNYEYESEILPQETGYEVVSPPVLPTNTRISTTKGLVPPSVVYDMGNIDALAAEDALAHLDSPAAPVYVAAKTSQSHEVIDTPSTPIFYDDAGATYSSHNEEELAPQFVSTEKLVVTSPVEPTVPVYDSDEEARNWAKYLAAVEAYSSSDPVTAHNPEERIATVTPSQEATSTPVYADNDDEEAAAAYAAYQKAMSDANIDASYNGIAKATDRMATTTEAEAAPVYYEDETSIAYAEAYAQYEADLAAANLNVGTGAESRIATAGTTTTEESPIYYDEASTYEYQNEVVAPQYAEERIATTTDTTSSTPTYEEELASYYAAINAANPEVSQGGVVESRIATTVDTTSTTSTSTSSTTDSIANSMYYEDEIIGAFETASDEELHASFVNHDRGATLAPQNPAWVNDAIASAISTSSSMSIIHNTFMKYNPLTVEYISVSFSLHLLY